MASANQSTSSDTATTRLAMNGDDERNYRVELFVYDLSRGFAKSMSSTLLGKQIEGIWHTGVVAYGREYFFGAGGIESCRPGGTILGEPDRTEDLGESQVPYQLFLEYIFGLGEATYKPANYDLFKHNCNNFSDEVSQFLCGRGIPKHILQVPDEVLNTELGDTLKSIAKDLDINTKESRKVNFANFNNNLHNYNIPTEIRTRVHDDSPELEELNNAIEQVRQNGLILQDRRNSLNEKIIKKEKKKKDKKEKKERKERKEKKKKSKSSGDPSDEGKESKKKKKNRHIEFADENSPCCSGTQSASHSRNNSEGDTPPSQIVQENPLPEITDSLNTLDLNNAPAVENSSSGEIVSTEPEPFERLPSPSSRGATPPDFDYNFPNRTTRMSDSMPEVQNEEVAPPEPSDAPPLQPEPEVEREPPILFRNDMDARGEFEGLVGATNQLLTPEEEDHMKELRSYIIEDEGSWALGENFNILFHRIFHDPSIPDEARLHLVRVMAAAALKDDVILLLHQDRKDHTIMNYANKVESLTPAHQESLALFFCNMFENLSPSEWLLYISEWTDVNGQQISNIRVTTKVAVNALLHSNQKVQDYGTAIMYNLGTKEVKTVVFDDVAPELAMAILQFLNNHPPEELLWRTMTALCRFCYSSTEVPALIKMIGPEPSAFKGVSERVDNVIDEIDAKLSRVRLF